MTNTTQTPAAAESELDRLQTLTVAQARELAMMRWELSVLMRQAPVAARVEHAKQGLLRRFPGPVQKLARLKRLVLGRLRPAQPASPAAGSTASSAAAEADAFALVLTADGDPVRVGLGTDVGLVVRLAPGAGPSRALSVAQSGEAPLRAPAPDSFCQWLVDNPVRLRRATAIAVEANDVMTLGLLKGRLVEGQTIVLDGSAGRSALANEVDPGGADAHGVRLVTRFPADWLDPLDGHLMPVPNLVAMRAWPTISVVMVSFNQADFIEEGLNSVLGQGYPNLQFIVVDGASKDGTVAILERYRDRLDHLVIEPDKGQSDGLNKGFARAMGEIVTWVNSDDLLEPGALFRAAQAFSAQKVDIVAGGCRQIGLTRATIINNHHTKLPYGLATPLPLGLLLEMDRFWLTGHFFYQPEVFFTRDIWQRAGGLLRTDLYYILDYDLWVRFAAAGAHVVHIPDFLACSRTHDQQKTVAGMPYMPEVQRLLAEYGRRLIPQAGTIG